MVAKATRVLATALAAEQTFVTMEGTNVYVPVALLVQTATQVCSLCHFNKGFYWVTCETTLKNTQVFNVIFMYYF
jgi:hypothetical protein